MLFSLHRHRPLFTVNPVLNDYIKNSNYKYMKNIVKNIEYKNKREKILGKEKPTHGSELIIPSIFLLSLTTIIYYFYSKRI
jgi:hypothetical protein